MKRRMVLTTGAWASAFLLARRAFEAKAASGGAEEATVTIDNFTFAPAELTVGVGTKVTWLNRDDIPHLVIGVATPRAFRSPALDTGDTFSFVFPTPGVFRYFCSLHPHMQGTVVVR